MSMQASSCSMHWRWRIAYPTVNYVKFATFAPILIYFITASLISYLIFLTCVCSYLFQEVFEPFSIYTYTSHYWFSICSVFDYCGVVCCIFGFKLWFAWKSTLFYYDIFIFFIIFLSQFRLMSSLLYHDKWSFFSYCLHLVLKHLKQTNRPEKRLEKQKLCRQMHGNHSPRPPFWPILTYFYSLLFNYTPLAHF